MSLCKCDNCGQEIPIDELENHRLYCIFTLQQKELENLIPCEICNQLIDFNVYNQHLSRCIPIPTFTSSDFPSLSNNQPTNLVTRYTQPTNLVTPHRPRQDISSLVQEINDLLNSLQNINNSYDNLIELEQNNVSLGVNKIDDFITKKKEKITCPICTTEVEEICETTCGHKFCYECISEWLKDNKKCPVCMIEFNEN